MKGFRVPVTYDIDPAREATLNNRYAPYDALKTNAVLQVDDDIFIRPQVLQGVTV